MNKAGNKCSASKIVLRMGQKLVPSDKRIIHDGISIFHFSSSCWLFVGVMSSYSRATIYNTQLEKFLTFHRQLYTISSSFHSSSEAHTIEFLKLTSKRVFTALAPFYLQTNLESRKMTNFD